jgi:hypothetical protein
MSRTSRVRQPPPCVLHSSGFDDMNIYASERERVVGGGACSQRWAK